MSNEQWVLHTTTMQNCLICWVLNNWNMLVFLVLKNADSAVDLARALSSSLPFTINSFFSSFSLWAQRASGRRGRARRKAFHTITWDCINDYPDANYPDDDYPDYPHYQGNRRALVCYNNMRSIRISFSKDFAMISCFWIEKFKILLLRPFANSPAMVTIAIDTDRYVEHSCSLWPQ